MQAISAIIITLNEEKNIGRCIDSLINMADEVLVIDSFSSDNTVNIAKEKGAKVIQHEWEGYAATKNFANRLAQFDYILSVDADEALSVPLQKSIREACKQGLEGIYEFNRLTSYCGKWIRHGGWYPDRKIRLFPKNGSNWKGEFVHETLTFDRDFRKTWLKGDLLHYSYYSIADHRQRIRKYAVLEAKKLIAKKGKLLLPGLLFSPPLKFVKMYFFKAGFMDGYYGLVVAGMSAYATFCKYREGMKLINGSHPLQAGGFSRKP